MIKKVARKVGKSVLKKTKEEVCLKEGEFHPSARIALSWYYQQFVDRPGDMYCVLESLRSSALAGNRLAEICCSTLDRIEKMDPVSDRYVLGLTWFIRDILEEYDEKHKEEAEKKKLMSTKEITA